ncbi:Na+/H+ antiporter NhaA [Fodinicola acaciae]|uniref:Na+/H+ antiporter NhaA n=1 Tax=Fodinicola acaciae TaxID=2681555 RepID=UPI0013CFE6C4|nr:Na+/H+ antiporter NhaA [Fodinicola acaciae]
MSKPSRAAAIAAAELARLLRTETVGGALLLAAAALALVLANTPLAGAYESIQKLTVGPDVLHLRLSLSSWAKDGLLAVFFYVAGCELKRELVTGELSSARRAALPAIAAMAGMVVPAVVCLAVGFGADGIGAAWPVPVATDIAFALAVLAISAPGLPPGVRIFLLSLAVVDDLGAILLIAALFTGKISLLALGIAVVLLAVFWLLQYGRVRSTWIYLPLVLGVWIAVHASGLHATLAGIALGLLTRVRTDADEDLPPAVRMEHLLSPLSAGVCVPLFAFFAAGVPVDGKALGGLFTDRVAIAVIVGLVVGKLVGVAGGALLAVRLRLGRLPDGMGIRDLLAVSLLAGCGFTVSLLIAELSFGESARGERITLAVMVGSVIAAVVAGIVLRVRARSS